jgi:hypothetical protein
MILVNFVIKYAYTGLMIENIDTEIQKQMDALAAIEKAEKRLVIVHHLMDDLMTELNHHRLIVDKEFNDINKLGKLSTAHIYHRILGKIGSQLEKEKEEYLLAILKYEDINKKYQLLQFEAQLLLEKIKKKNEIIETKEALIARKTQLIYQSKDHVFFNALKKMDDKMDAIKHSKIEISEANLAADQLITKLSDLIREMEKNFDPWLQFFEKNGNTMYKNRPFYAGFRNTISLIDHLTTNLHTQVADISHELKVKIDLDNYTKFVQNFHKSAIDGWVSSSHMYKAILCLKENIENVQRLKVKLADLNKKANREIEILNNEKKLYIEST